MLPRFYVPQVLCSPLSTNKVLVRDHSTNKVLRFTRDRTYVPRVLCSPGTKKVVRNTMNSTKSIHITGFT